MKTYTVRYEMGPSTKIHQAGPFESRIEAERFAVNLALNPSLTGVHITYLYFTQTEEETNKS